TLLNGMACGADTAMTGEDVDERVEIGTPRHAELRAGLNRGVRQRDRSVRRAWSGMLANLAGDDAYQCAAILRSDQTHLRAFDRLILRRRELRIPGQVDPQLDPVEYTAALDEFGGRSFDVQDAGTGGHPLRGAVGDQAAAAVRILVGEAAVDHVRHGLEPAMRMPRRAPRLTGLVLDLTHLIHVHERVERGRGDAGEGADDGEALALETAGSRRDRADGAFGLGM